VKVIHHIVKVTIIGDNKHMKLQLLMLTLTDRHRRKSTRAVYDDLLSSNIGKGRRADISVKRCCSKIDNPKA